MAQTCLLYANVCLLLLRQSKTMINSAQNILQHNLNLSLADALCASVKQIHFTVSYKQFIEM